MAQLYTRDKCEGIHPFLVQLRDEETHEPLPGQLFVCLFVIYLFRPADSL